MDEEELTKLLKDKEYCVYTINNEKEKKEIFLGHKSEYLKDFKYWKKGREMKETNHNIIKSWERGFYSFEDILDLINSLT